MSIKLWLYGEASLFKPAFLNAVEQYRICFFKAHTGFYKIYTICCVYGPPAIQQKSPFISFLHKKRLHRQL